MSVAQLCPTLWPDGLQPTRLLCPWDFPGKDTGMGCHFLLQGIFPIQGLNPRLLCRFFTDWAAREALRNIMYVWYFMSSCTAYSFFFSLFSQSNNLGIQLFYYNSFFAKLWKYFIGLRCLILWNRGLRLVILLCS